MSPTVFFAGALPAPWAATPTVRTAVVVAVTMTWSVLDRAPSTQARECLGDGFGGVGLFGGHRPILHAS